MLPRYHSNCGGPRPSATHRVQQPLRPNAAHTGRPRAFPPSNVRLGSHRSWEVPPPARTIRRFSEDFGERLVPFNAFIGCEILYGTYYSAGARRLSRPCLRICARRAGKNHCFPDRAATPPPTQFRRKPSAGPGRKAAVRHAWLRNSRRSSPTDPLRDSARRRDQPQCRAPFPQARTAAR